MSSSSSCTLLKCSAFWSAGDDNRRCSLGSDCSCCEMLSRSDVVLWISLLLPAVTELTLQALHMTLIVREHVISIVNGKLIRQKLFFLTSARIHCRTRRCTHSNERLLMSPCPERGCETRNDSQRNCHCSDLAVTEDILFPPASRCQDLVTDHLVRSEPKLALSQCFRDTTLERSSLCTVLHTPWTHTHEEIAQHLLRYHVVLVLRFLGLIVVCCGVLLHRVGFDRDPPV